MLRKLGSMIALGRVFFFSSRRRHTRFDCDWSSDVCSSDLDDDQSIYAFRGARVGNMQDFVREFDVRQQIKLEQNYRSYSYILDCANALISHNSQRLGKNLRTTQGPGEPVRIYEAPTDMAEAQ